MINQELVRSIAEPWNVKLVVRKWMPQLDISMEFRGFIYHRKLTALSQYFDMLYFPQIVENHELIEQKVKQFFGKISPLQGQ